MKPKIVSRDIELEISKRFRYEDGKLFYNYKCARCGKIGEECGWVSKHGYMTVKIWGEKFFVHRIIWFMHYGAWPTNEIDHFDRNKLNNRIENLRDVSKSTNMTNTYAREDNKIGEKHIYYFEKAKRYIVQRRRNGSAVHVGCFKTLSEAISARDRFFLENQLSGAC